ncbi:unnamed protein product, partial [Coregonus sp. 'balchen']
WISMVTQLNSLEGPESESQNHPSELCRVLKGRSFPLCESFFLDEWEATDTPADSSGSVHSVPSRKTHRTSRCRPRMYLIQSAAGLVCQVLSTSVSIVENDRFQSATNLVSQDEDSTLRASNQPEVHVADAKVASKKEDEINKDESRLTCHHNTIQGDH